MAGRIGVLWLVSPVLSTIQKTKDSDPSSKQDNLGYQGPRPTRRTGAPQRPSAVSSLSCWLGREGVDKIRNPGDLGLFFPRVPREQKDYSSMKNIQDLTFLFLNDAGDGSQGLCMLGEPPPLSYMSSLRLLLKGLM